MVIDLKDLTISFEELPNGNKKYHHFKDVYDVQESNFRVNEDELEDFGINSDFQDGYFKLKIKPD